MCIVDADGGWAQAAHDFSRIGEEDVADVFCVGNVIVAVKYGIVLAGLGDRFGDFRIVCEKDVALVDDQLGELTVESDVWMFRSNLTKKKLIAIVIAKNGVDHTVELSRHLVQ